MERFEKSSHIKYNAPLKKTLLSGPLIAVIGSRTAGKRALDEAAAIGRLLAEAGCVLVCGGLGGVMEAAARGANASGGLTIGILPGERRSEANPNIDIAIPTGLGIARNAVIARTADAAIAVRGGYGTLSEIAFFLQMEKPVIGLGSWEIKGVLAAPGPEEALRIALERLAS